MFCVECGREGPTVDGQCASCFATRHPLVEPRPHVDVPRCQACGAFLVAGAWIRGDLDRLIPRILEEKVPPRAPFRRADHAHVAHREDDSNLLLTVTASGRHGDVEVSQAFRTRLRLKPSLCDVCAKQRSRYFEGIVQVRAEGRELTPKEIRAVRTFVGARADRARESSRDFVSRTEEIHGGLDFYVSTNAFAKELARDLASTYGGSVTTTSKLFGQRDGREVFRVTSLVRLSAFQVGDVVRHKRAVFEVLRIAGFVTIRDLASGEARRFKARDLRGARRVEAERFEATLERSESGEIIADHPETGRTQSVATRAAAPGRAVVVWTDDAAYVSALPMDASKA